ncbi:AsmA-like C-terminal region-containing protein [Rhabdaerophilum sp. SD176]|uniref:YhdP family protein n=1 Tax=Rhabdaerophilum sp. SD176 TaxID=2983548 RepID=UPI0024E00526|nr:AsmA-like C-terminal region-containing protein [Rhabdaerophilum sp. SD176]
MPVPRRRLGVLGWCSATLGVVLLLALAGAGVFVWMIQKDRNSAFLREQLLGALGNGLGTDHSLSVAQAGLRFAGLTSTFSIGRLAITNPANGTEADLESVEVEVPTFSLWRQRPLPTSVRLQGVRLVIPAAPQEANPLAANEALTLFRAILAGAHFAASGQDPTFQSLQRIEGRDIALFQRQPDGRILPIQQGLRLEVVRDGEGQIAARLSKEGTPYSLALKAASRALADGGRMMMLESGEVEWQAVQMLAAGDFGLLDPRMKLRLTLHSRINAEGALVEKGARFHAYGGRVTPPDPDMPPFLLDEASIDLRMPADSPDILLDRIRIRFNETHLVLGGRITPPKEGDGGLAVTLRAERAEIDRLSPGEAPILLDSAELEALVTPDLRSLRVDRLHVQEDQGQMTLRGLYSLENGGLVENRVELENLEMRKALRIWPVWVAPPVRRWLIDHAEAGRLAQLRLDLRLAGQVLDDANKKRPIPDDALSATYRLEDVTLRPLKDASALTALNGHGRVSGRKTDAVIESANVEPQAGQRFSLKDARLSVADTAARPSVLDMTIPAEGRLDALMAFLAAPSLRDLSGLPPDAGVSDGQFSGLATVSLPLVDNPPPKDVRAEFRADLRQVSIDNIVKNERLEGGTFTLQTRNGGLTLRGEARLFGVPQQIEVKSEPGRPGQAVAKATLDETVLARRGIDIRGVVQGPLQTTVTLPLSKQASSFDVEIDLAKARIDAGIPGLSKRAGQPGRTKFTVVSRPDGTWLDNLELDLAPASLRGRVELLRDGQFAKADFSTFKLSGGDNARLLAERQRGVMRLALRGNSFDLRPFLRGFQAGKLEDGRPADAKPPDFDLDLQSTVLIGFNGELMSGVETRMARRQGRLTQLALKGQFGAAAVSASSLEGQRETMLINASSQDGGALLRFLDIYNKAYGGRMAAEILVGAQTQQGVVQLRDFVIRGESALRQVGASGRTISATQSLGEEVPFTKMRADFARRPGRLDLREAVIWGGQLGGTLEGSLNYAADRVDLKGVFVPAYALNNFFASVPLLGPILGGAQYEGLFAVPFVISGRASAPVMRINPVSAIAPGFLRKLFEIQREGGGNAPALNRAN